MVLDRRGMSSLSGQVPGIIEQLDVAGSMASNDLSTVNQRLLSVARSPYFLASQSRNNLALRGSNPPIHADSTLRLTTGRTLSFHRTCTRAALE